MKISRNDFCPCESGLKYKKCCLNVYEKNVSDKKNENKSLSVFKKRVANRFDNKFILSDNESQKIKMSAVILEFADEILDQAQTKSQRESAVSIACVAWNMALLGSNASESAKEDIFKKFADSNQEIEDIDNILSFLIRKKLNKYPHVNRFVVDYQYTEVNGDRRLNVASTEMSR